MDQKFTGHPPPQRHRKFEVDLRSGHYRLAPSPLKIVAIVFLSSQSAGGRPLLEPLPKHRTLAKLADEQAYARNLTRWNTFSKSVSKLHAFELRRGRHRSTQSRSCEGCSIIAR